MKRKGAPIKDEAASISALSYGPYFTGTRSQDTLQEIATETREALFTRFH